MNTFSLQKLVFLLAMLALTLGCVLPNLTAPSVSNPTSDPGLIQTIVVATAGAAQTQTALVLPPPSDTATATLPPTLPPTETPTTTPTVIFIIPTKTYTPTNTPLPTNTKEPGTGSEGCELVAQSPANDTTYGSRDRFTAEWTMRNTSSDTWRSDSLDFFYSGGRDMHETDIIDLPNNVRSGREVTFEVDMRAPGNAGTYTSTWTLGTRRDALCIVSVRIRVK